MAAGIVFARPAVTGVVSSVGMPRLPVALLFSMPVVSDVPTMASARRFPPRCSGGSEDFTTPCWTSRLSLPVVYSRYKPTRINIDESQSQTDDRLKSYSCRVVPVSTDSALTGRCAIWEVATNLVLVP